MKKKELVRLCKSVGVMLLDSGDCVRVDAPVGYRLMGNGLHNADLYTEGWKREEVYEELSNDIGDGVEKCDDPDCDACVHEPMTFEQIQELYRGERLA